MYLSYTIENQILYDISLYLILVVEYEQSGDEWSQNIESFKTCEYMTLLLFFTSESFFNIFMLKNPLFSVSFKTKDIFAQCTFWQLW